MPACQRAFGSVLGCPRTIVDAGLPAADVVALIEGGADSVDTLGGTISLALVEGQVVIGGATVITTDLFTSNGVIHLIDQVILPPENE